MPDPNAIKLHRVHQRHGWTKDSGELTTKGEREAERRHHPEPEPDLHEGPFAAPEPINDCGLM